jgi:hypothetical protein
MNAQELMQTFLSSEHGAQAVQALQAQGVSPESAEQYLGHALQAGMDHTHEHAQSGGLLGEHPGRNFFAAFTAGLLRGDGVMGALEDGATGVITGRVAEYLTSLAGIDGGMASTIAAAATPYVTGFLKQHLGL